MSEAQRKHGEFMAYDFANVIASEAFCILWKWSGHSMTLAFTYLLKFEHGFLFLLALSLLINAICDHKPISQFLFKLLPLPISLEGKLGDTEFQNGVAFLFCNPILL